MKNIHCSMFPGGRQRALTLSYDDGTIHDRRLVEIMNRHGIRGTFHLNGGRLGADGGRFLSREEVAVLFQGHEVSAHSLTHPFLDALPPSQVAVEMLEDRRALEALVGYPVRGMSYPCGTYNEALRQQLPALGIEYSRTVQSTDGFDVPSDFLQWDPTCHHKSPKLMELADRFLAPGKKWRPCLFYLWGHSYEFENDKNWELIERFSGCVGGREDVWYATNIEIVDYLNACRGLRFAFAGNAVCNPAGLEVWIDVDGTAVRVPPGQTVRL